MEKYLAQFLAFTVWNEGPQNLEAGINALHATSFIAVGNLPS